MTRGRPRGPLRDMLCRALEQQPGTVRQVAGRLVFSMQATRETQSIYGVKR